MTRNKTVYWAKFAAVLSVIPVLLYAYVGGPDPGKSGVPGESTCSEAGCHTGTALNGSGGSVSVTFPDGLTYTPGVKQHLTVTVADAAQRRWGFQLTARSADNPQAQAGTFASTDAATQVLCASVNLLLQGPPCGASMPLLYIEHTESGTRLGTRESASFEFDWTPPDADVGPVVVYVAGNAANGDNNNTGDHIYTAQYTLTPAGAATSNKPSIDASNGVVNFANPQQGIGPLTWFTITGTNLASEEAEWAVADDGTLPATVGGVSVSVGGKAAVIGSVTPARITALTAADLGQGPVDVVVTNNDAASDPVSITAQPYAPAVFLWAGKYAAATRTDGSMAVPAGTFDGVDTTAPKPGDILVLWGTGFGPTTPDAIGGQPTAADKLYSVTGKLNLRIAGMPVQVYGAVLSPGFAGLYHVTIRVPDGTPAGDQPLEGDVGGVELPAGILINIADVSGGSSTASGS